MNLTIKKFVCHMMLGMWTSHMCIDFSHMKVKMIHVEIHVQKEQEHTHNHSNLQKKPLN